MHACRVIVLVVAGDTAVAPIRVRSPRNMCSRIPRIRILESGVHCMPRAAPKVERFCMSLLETQ